MRSEFIGPESPAWNRFLADAPHDFYHLPGYVALSAQDRLSAPEANGRATAFHATDDAGRQFFLTLIIRPLPDRCGAPDLYDAITPYGYACPLVIGEQDAEGDAFVERAIQELRDGLMKQNVVSVFARSHPTIPLPQEPLRRTGVLVQHGSTIWIDLTLSPEELWHQTRAGHRSEINRARKNGYVVEIQDDWRDFAEFFRAYTETMRRVGASEHYYFSRAYFDELQRAVGDVLHLAVCKKDGAVACAGMFAEVCGIVQYHLSGTTDEFHSQYPTKVMLDSVRQWARERGNTVMHLGGGYGGNEDSLFAFKAGFSHLRAPFYTWRCITDVARYDSLCHAWEARTGQPASPPDRFFPAYRAP